MKKEYVMKKIKVMVNGIPGNVAVIIAKHIMADQRFELVPYSLTGPEITEKTFSLDHISVSLLAPEIRDQAIDSIKENEGGFICVDYTHPSAVNGNAEFYCKHGIAFVMGTTGGDRKRLEQMVVSSSLPAVIAPNMAKQIVGLQAMLEWSADNFPDLFKGYQLEIKESHQKGKADTSGTAKAIATCFKDMGVVFSEKDIIKERDPKVQKTTWGVPEAYIGGHGYHTYTLVSDDQTVKFVFSHNVNGRDVYAKGTLDAVSYLFKKIEAGEKARIFTMIDVLKGN
jgi:4-hydroxy-tetrahydrodipicolinate reductase